MELGIGTPYEPKRAKNHDTKQATEQQNETKIKRKIKLSPQ